MSTGTLRFVHKFSRTVSCELRVPDHAPPPMSRNVLTVEWTGQIKRKNINEYRQWALTTHQVLSDRWGVTLLYVLGVASNLTELWEFKPNGTPKLVERIKAGL